jgi:hypothetical protein
MVQAIRPPLSLGPAQHVAPSTLVRDLAEILIEFLPLQANAVVLEKILLPFAARTRTVHPKGHVSSRLNGVAKRARHHSVEKRIAFRRVPKFHCKVISSSISVGGCAHQRKWWPGALLGGKFSEVRRRHKTVRCSDLRWLDTLPQRLPSPTPSSPSH